MSPFVPILLNRGFCMGASGRFFNSDALRTDSGITVELRDEGAVVSVVFNGDLKMNMTFPDTPEGVQEFRAVLPA